MVDKTYTVKGAARALKVPEHKIQELVDSGRLKTFVFFEEVRVHEDDLQALISSARGRQIPQAAEGRRACMDRNETAPQPPFLFTQDEVNTMDPMTRDAFERARAQGAAKIVEKREINNH